MNASARRGSARTTEHASTLAATLEALLEADRTVAFKASLAQICGGDQVAGLFLSQCVYWTRRTTDPDGWFYKSQTGWQKEICLTRSQLDRLRRMLENKGLLQCRLKRASPPVLEYRLDLVALEMALRQVAGNRQIDLPETDKLTSSEPANRSAENRQNNLPETGKTYMEGESSSEISKKSNQRVAALAPAAGAARGRQTAPRPPNHESKDHQVRAQSDKVDSVQHEHSKKGNPPANRVSSFTNGTSSAGEGRTLKSAPRTAPDARQSKNDAAAVVHLTPAEEWDKVLEFLSERIGPAHVDRFLRPSRVVGCECNQLVIAVPRRLRGIFRQHLAPKIREAIRAAGVPHQDFRVSEQELGSSQVC